MNGSLQITRTVLIANLSSGEKRMQATTGDGEIDLIQKTLRRKWVAEWIASDPHAVWQIRLMSHD